MTQTDAQAQTDDEHDPVAQRIVAARQLAGFPLIRGHRPPRLAVRLDAPPDTAALLARVAQDRQALQAQVQADRDARMHAIHQQFAAGDMTPNQRTISRVDKWRGWSRPAASRL